jgi:hypothetical protein
VKNRRNVRFFIAHSFARQRREPHIKFYKCWRNLRRIIRIAIWSFANPPGGEMRGE